MYENIKKVIRPIYYWVYTRYYYLLEQLFPPKMKDYKKIPIIINNRNRLTSVLKLIDSLEKKGYRNIYIIDNDSSYPPLLEYYNSRCPYKIFRLKENVGYLALWKTNIFRMFRNDFYVYTDSDVVPLEECPNDFMQVFYNILKKYPFANKVGFSLMIDDIPDHFSEKDEVIKWETQFYQNMIEENLYLALIDTTFALYRPRVKSILSYHIQSFRTASPYSARHLPWYVDSSNLSEEEQYYIKHSKTSTHWTNFNIIKSF